MRLLRLLALNKRALACALIALALAMKLFVPSGFMPTFADGRIEISICTGMGPMKMVMAIPGMDHGKPGDSQHGKIEQPCAFAGLSTPSLGSADPFLLALAILFVMALALRPMVQRVSVAPPYLRPPLRGPPVRL